MEDDALHGFSSDDEGVDLLASILDGEKQSVSGQEVKRTTNNSNNIREKSHVGPSSEHASDDEMALMKAKLKTMENELLQLRQMVANERPPPQVRPRAATKEHQDRIAVRPASTPVCAPTGGPPQEREVSLAIARQRREDAEEGIITEKYSGLRIKNPLISSDQMKQRMDGRKMIRLPNIGSHLKGSDIEGDWVTMGVVVDKLPPKDSAKGEKFSVWKLSDLSSQKSLISLFLFGKAFQEHWKTPAGYVVALLNPTIMPNKESGEVDRSNVALSLDHPQKVMQVGVSQDFTLCKATTKNGKKCSNFASKSDGGYCDYHVQGAYNKMRSQRMECQRGYGPTASKLHDKLFQKSKTEVFFYGGQSFSAGGGGGGGGTRERHSADKTSVKLFAPGARESVAKVTTEIANTRLSSGVHRDKMGVVTHESSDLMKQVVRGHSMGAQYLNVQQMKEEASKDGVTKSASQLLQEHSLKIKSKEKATPTHVVTKATSGSKVGAEGSSDGGDLFTPDNIPVTLQRDEPSIGPPHMVVLTSPTSGARTVKKGISLPSPAPRPHKSHDTPVPPPTLKPSSAKLKALALVYQKGPIGKPPANHTSLSDNQREAVLRRVQSCDDVPVAKKAKVDMCSPDVQSILKAKSSHDWQVKEEEWQVEEAYFDQLEKKEAMEEKLKTLKELSVTVVQCKECSYVAEGAGEMCKRQNHALTRFRALKRFFECQACKERCATYNNMYPTKQCRKCGGNSYKQTCVWKERQGPKLPTENLLLRGEEIKFLNSLS